MQIEFSGMAMANLAKTAKASQGGTVEASPLAMANLANLANFDPDEDAFSRFSRFSHSHPAEITFLAGPKSEPVFSPLTDSGLARLIVGTAQAHGVEPLAVWQWLDVGDIEGLLEGEPTHLAAFYVAVGSAVALGQLQPSGHALTPPPDLQNATTGSTAQQRAIPTARPLVTVGMVTCGACRNWTPPPGDGAGKCGKGVKPTLAQAPLCKSTPRYCQQFKPINSREVLNYCLASYQ